VASGNLIFPSAATADVEPPNVAAAVTKDDVAPANACVHTKPTASNEAVAAIRKQVANGKTIGEPMAGEEDFLRSVLFVACSLSAHHLL